MTFFHSCESLAEDFNAKVETGSLLQALPTAPFPWMPIGPRSGLWWEVGEGWWLKVSPLRSQSFRLGHGAPGDTVPALVHFQSTFPAFPRPHPTQAHGVRTCREDLASALLMSSQVLLLGQPWRALHSYPPHLVPIPRRWLG